MPKINPRIRFIEKFLAHFNSAFSTTHQRSIFREFIYAMFSDYKRMSLAAITNNTTLNYQKLQYFFSEADWNTKELNDIRIGLLQNQRTTQANNKGVLAIDDTVCPKPHAEKTEGASVQYCGCLSKILNEPPETIGECNGAVASLIIIDSSFLLTKNKEMAACLYNIKSARFKEKLKSNKVLHLYYKQIL